MEPSMSQSSGKRNQSNRSTSVGSAFLASIVCALIVGTNLQSISAAHRLPTTFESAQAPMSGSSLQPKTEVMFHTIGKGSRSGVRERLHAVARSQGEWQKLWQRHTSAETNPSPPPAIDFNKEFVGAIFLGEKPTGGFAVEIVKAERNGGELVINYKEVNPAPGAIVTQALTQPFHIVRIDGAVDSKVTFRRES
jgi:hypothetical protein